MKGKILSILVIFTFVFSMTLSSKTSANTFSNVNGLDEDIIEFLIEHNVDLSPFEEEAPIVMSISDDTKTNANSYNCSLTSLMNAAAAYGFTDEQIQAM